MTSVLTVMSSMNPHMIRVHWDGMVWMLGVGQSCPLGRATIVDSVVCSMSRLEEKSFWH
jgi:alpha-tubulin suppressor-like RCC1 family protein